MARLRDEVKRLQEMELDVLEARTADQPHPRVMRGAKAGLQDKNTQPRKTRI